MKYTKAFTKQLASSFEHDYEYRTEKQQIKKQSIQMRNLKQGKQNRWESV